MVKSNKNKLFSSPRPTYLERNEKVKKWKIAEIKTAKKIGGNLQPGSGNQMYKKGDIIKDMFLLDSKSTDGKSTLINLDWLIKIENEARGMNKYPAIVIVFNKVPEPLDKWILLRLDDFIKI